MPPKRSRIDNGHESDIQESIKLMKDEILEKFEAQKNEISERFDRRIDELAKQLPKANEKQRFEKAFVLEHTFTNVSGMEAESSLYSGIEDHYGQKWFIWIKRENEHLDVFLAVRKPEGDYLIEAEQQVQISGRYHLLFSRKEVGSMRMESGEQGQDNNASGTLNFITWEELKKNYLEDDKLVVQIRVKVVKMAGIVKPKAFDFGEANKEHSDVVLKVGNEKFFVWKGFLTRRSSFFTTLFSENFEKGEIELPDTDAQDFQNFLEVLHGDAKPDEYTVEGILLLNDKFNDKNVRRECEEFLKDKSTKPLVKKLQLSSRFQLDKLTKKFVSDIKDKEEYKAILQELLGTLNLTVSTALHEKSMTFM